MRVKQPNKQRRLEYDILDGNVARRGRIVQEKTFEE